ncbi:MAG: cation:proton antiporter [Burkholderiaceae bacterium]
MNTSLAAVSPVADAPIVLLMLGMILAASIAADLLAHRLHLPRISVLVLLGVMISASHALPFMPVVPAWPSDLTDALVTLALVMVAFLLGGDLKIASLRRLGRPIAVLSLSVVIASVLVVSAGLILLGFPLEVAVGLGAIAAATDPAAVREVIHSAGNRHPWGLVILGVVAVDDAWGVIVFGLVMAALGFVTGGEGLSALAGATWEIGGALMLGLLVGLPASALTGRLSPGEPTRVEAIAVVLILAGAAGAMHVSPLLAGMVAGMLVANLSRHHTRSLRAIEHIEWPFLVFFFVLAGAKLQFEHLPQIGTLLLAYVLLRVLGRWLGGLLASRWLRGSRHPSHLPPSLGLALTPQAGVALGMALLVTERFPQAAATLVPAAVAGTLVFEIGGPLLTAHILARTR